MKTSDKWMELTIEPRDVLFFRDARPMEASSIGAGANWPVPQVFHNALLSAMHEMPRQTCEHEHRPGEGDKNSNSSFRFGGLKSIGVFPEKNGVLFLPTPADVQCLDNSRALTALVPEKIGSGCCDLPRPLTHVLHKPGGPTKHVPGAWMCADSYEKYLEGNLADDVTTTAAEDLYVVERRLGIAIDTQTGATEQGKLYQAEYMRLKKQVALRGYATCAQRRYADGTDEDVLNAFIGERKQIPFLFGGQQGVAFMGSRREGHFSLKRTPVERSCVKWATLTPSIFTGGWLPSWVDSASGDVWHYEKPPKKSNESRAAWRKRMKRDGILRTSLGKLVAACVPKPIVYSGWRSHGGREDKQGPHPTRLCVPAGAVYYFETDCPSALCDYLHGITRSDELAEKGFGLGVCGVWDKKEND